MDSMTEKMKDAIKRTALHGYEKYHANDHRYTPEDAFVYSLEELDTGYDLTESEWDDLEHEVANYIKSHIPA